MPIEQMYDTPHQPPALTDQDIQCHPQDLTQHTVKYKTMNGTDVDNTHNIQCNLTANIVVQFKRLQYCSEHQQNEDLCVGGGGERRVREGVFRSNRT